MKTSLGFVLLFSFTYLLRARFFSAPDSNLDVLGKFWRRAGRERVLAAYCTGKTGQISDDDVKITDSLYFKHLSCLLFCTEIFEGALPPDDTSLVYPQLEE